MKQILADKFGNGFTWENVIVQFSAEIRSCWKVTFPAVDPDLRRRMGACAVKAAKAANYCSAGTVEFLLTGIIIFTLWR